MHPWWAVARAIGGIAVDRGSGSDQPLRDAEAALRAGEVVIVLPQGTIPRGDAFFDPDLQGQTGTARLAASTGAMVVPVGLWGTEEVGRLGPGSRYDTGAPPTHGARAGRANPCPFRIPTPGRHRHHHDTPSALCFLRSPGDAVSRRPRSWRGRSHLGEVAARQRDHPRRQRRVSPPGSGPGNRCRGPGRAQARPEVLAAPHRRATGRAGHRDQRQDHDGPAARRSRSARWRRGREQRDGFEHAAGPRRGAGGLRAAHAVLEVDEIYLPRVLTATRAAAVVLLNLSRDQLDRTNEVRMVAGRWRPPSRRHRTPCRGQRRRPARGLEGRGRPRTSTGWVPGWLAPRCRGLPPCEGRIVFDEGGWPRGGCGFARPGVEVTLCTRPMVCRAALWADGRTQPLRLALPGRFNQANALMAVVAAEADGWSRRLRWPHGRRRRSGRSLHRRGRSTTSTPGSCWPRTPPGGTSSSTWWRGRTRRWWSASTRGWQTEPTPAGCGTCPRAAGRPFRRGYRRPIPRSLGPPALRGSGPHGRARPRPGGRDRRRTPPAGPSTSSATTRRFTTCWGLE